MYSIKDHKAPEREIKIEITQLILYVSHEPQFGYRDDTWHLYDPN